jgi:hypothetical protein
MRAIGTGDKRLLLFPLALYSIGMAYVEAAVVVYLRRIYYPEGFELDIAWIEPHILRTEIGREIATIAMIIGLTFASHTRGVRRAGVFLLVFGMWDIFYYVFLKAMLGWPESFLTMDVLFLIPAPWISPVILPVSISLVMVGVGLWLLMRRQIGG